MGLRVHHQYDSALSCLDLMITFTYRTPQRTHTTYDASKFARTATYTNTENHPTLIDDGPLVSRRRPPIVLSKKTGIPLGVLPTTQPKVKHTYV